MNVLDALCGNLAGVARAGETRGNAGPKSKRSATEVVLCVGCEPSGPGSKQRDEEAARFYCGVFAICIDSVHSCPMSPSVASCEKLPQYCRAQSFSPIPPK
jgi:hypothetical protein